MSKHFVLCPVLHTEDIVVFLYIYLSWSVLEVYVEVEEEERCISQDFLNKNDVQN